MNGSGIKRNTNKISSSNERNSKNSRNKHSSSSSRSGSSTHLVWLTACHDDDCYQISPSLEAIGTAPNSVERKFLITSTTLCPFQ
jgi:hypothetical protein